MSSSFSYERYDRRSSRSNRGLFTYWVPVITVATLAAGGLAAWVWSARSDHDSTDDEDADLSYGEERREFPTQGPPGGFPGGAGSETYRSEERSTTTGYEQDQSIGGFVQGAARSIQGMVRRTPSPQQLWDTASKRAAAGVAAAGAMVGGALSAIREEGSQDYEDHERWDEEQRTADRRNVTATSAESRGAAEEHTDTFNRSVRDGPSNGRQYGKRKTVAVVVSAESTLEHLPEEETKGGYATEQAVRGSHMPMLSVTYAWLNRSNQTQTLLSQLPRTDFSRINLLILIYAPHYASQQNPASGGGNRPPSSAAESLGSSYANVTPGATPGDELQSIDPQPCTPALSTHDKDASAELYDLLYQQASKLVEKPANILTFSTPQGFVHMLKHLQPALVYVVDSLSGTDGANIAALRGFVGQVVVVVGGEGGQLGGLIDTEDEGYGEKKEQKEKERWWASSDMIGLGKGVEIVDGVKLAEDFERRVSGRE